MIHTIIFDIGNVLVNFCWQKMFTELGFSGEKFDTIAKATVYDDAWNEFDRGILSTSEIIDIFAEKAPMYKSDIARIFDNPRLMISQFDYAIPWIQELKARGYRILILSNFSEITHDACRDNELNFLDYVDGEVFSYREHLIKPDPAIYQLLCDRYNLDPSEAVFIDDNPANVTSSRAFGLNTIHFQSYDQARKELEAHLTN